MTNRRTDLTPDEQALVGNAADWVTEAVVPPRSKSTTAMFSLRVDRRTFEALSDMAERRGLTFSEVAREALRQYVDSGGRLISISATDLFIEAETIHFVEAKAQGKREGKVFAGKRQARLASSG
jgi:antitoxin component of RelBE/YafQ-DinJ toxin-antitoxin module